MLADADGILNLFMRLLRLVDKVFPPKIVYAHCDVPCGIYDPKSAQIAAATVVRMVDLITNPPIKVDEGDNTSIRNFHNAMTRYVIVKEEHAQKCKEELLILWTDFFKEEHLKQFPKLHDTFWNAAKLCSKNKQEVDLKSAEDLKKAVDEIADIFAKAKAAAKQ